MGKIPLLDYKKTDKIYKKWEKYYEIPIKYCYKFLRDELVEEVKEQLKKNDVIIVYGTYRTGKSTLIFYIGKKLELAGKKVNYLEMGEQWGLERYDRGRDTLVENIEIDPKHNVMNYDIVFFDEVGITLPEQNWPVMLKISEEMIKNHKKVCFFIHPHIFYQEKGMEYAKKLYSLGRTHNIFLFGYSVEQEKKLLKELKADKNETEWCLKNLHGSRNLYNYLMLNVFEREIKLQKVLESVKSGKFVYDWIGIRYCSSFHSSKVKSALKKYVKGKASSDDEFLLLYRGILSKQNKKIYLPTPYKIALKIMKKEDLNLASRIRKFKKFPNS